MNIQNLKESLSTLQESQTKYDENQVPDLESIFADSCVKRFEYTLETAIKLMRKVLKNEYAKDETDLTINNIFRMMNSYGFIRSWTAWKDYYQQRNNTVHEYDIKKSRDLLRIIPAFIDDCEFLVQKLEDKFQQEQYFQTIGAILKENCNDDSIEFFAYGSRVKGTFQANSDLDVLIKGDIVPSVLENIKANLDVSSIPFIVHFVHRNDINDDFYESIKADLRKL